MPTGGPEARPSGITAPEARRTSGSTWPALATVRRRVDLSSLTHAAVTKLSSTPSAENDSLSWVRMSRGALLGLDDDEPEQRHALEHRRRHHRPARAVADHQARHGEVGAIGFGQRLDAAALGGLQDAAALAAVQVRLGPIAVGDEDLDEA